MELIKPIKQKSQPGLYKKVYKESGDKIWNSQDGIKRKIIIERVGPEYSQINQIAIVLAELIKLIPDAYTNPVILNAMAKFEEINQIRNGNIPPTV